MRIWVWNAVVLLLLMSIISRDYVTKQRDQRAIKLKQSSLQNTNIALPDGLVCQSGASTVNYDGPDEICLGQTIGDFTASFVDRDPNLVKPHYDKFFINEIDPDTQGNDTAEFVEILGPPNTSLNGFVLVFFNGDASNDASYRSLDLDRFSTDSCGFFLAHGPKVPDPHPANSLYDTLITVGNGFIQNGPDAIGLYQVASFPNTGGAATAIGLVDAVVYNNAAPVDAVLRDTLLQTTQFRDNTAASLARMPDGNGLFVLDSTPTPGTFNAGITGYNYVWLLTKNDTILESKEGLNASGFPVNFTLNDEGDYCVYGLSYYGELADFQACGFVSTAQIKDSIAAGYCGTLSDNCQSFNVSGGFSFLSASTTACSTFDANGTYQVILKWLGTAQGPFQGPDYMAMIAGSAMISGDTTCFTSDPIPGGDTLYYRLLNDLCEDTVTNSITQFCDYCSFMIPPDHLEDIGVCDIGPVTITPAGGGIPQIKPAADLFFSEYVEGSLNNKCLEIYNGTPDTVDLDAEHYRVSIYFNGDTNLLTQGIIDLTGKIPPDGTFVLCHNLVSLPAFINASNQLSPNLDFNGDDFIKLTHDGILIDAIGQIGFDPGAQWGSGLQSTQDNTLRRYSQICQGDTDSTDVYLPAASWAGFPINDSAGIGTHTYTAMENIVDYYKFYSGDPLIGGQLLDSGLAYQTTVAAGSTTTIYYTAYHAGYQCESTSDSVKLLSTKSNLICNDFVHVSLPVSNCEKTVFAEDVLQNPGNCSFPVLLSYPQGTTIYKEGNIIDRSHIGYKMVFSVRDLYGNSCWGYLMAEDKSAAEYQCKKDTVSCFELGAILSTLDSVVDGCAGTVRYVQQILYSDSACDHTFLGRMIRIVIATDQWQNSNVCQDTFLIKKSTFSEVNGPDKLNLNCDLFAGSPAEFFIPDSLLSYQRDGLISEDFQVVPFLDTFDMYPSPKALCNLKTTYHDVVFPLCGNGMVIRREWDILDWCTLRDTFLIQYIHIEDLAAPRASALSPVLEANANAHDCYGTITRYRRQSFSDCSDHTDAMHYDYPDPAQNGKIVRVEGEILDPIRLPVGVHQVIFTSVDACGHFTEKAVPAIITDITPPTPVCDSHLVSTVDPQTCWSRIYATDLDQGSRDNCQSTLHFAAASMDSIVYWQNYWYGYLEQKCGKTAYWAHINTYQNLIDHWINCYVFGDYVELASCVDKQVVLRAYEADYIPLYDPHGTILTNHEWYCLHATSFGRTELNYSYFKSGFKSVTRPKLDCIDTLRLRYYDAPVFDPEESYLPTQRKKAYCTLSLLDSSRLLTNGCNGIRYNDCMTTVTVVDKTPPVASTPDDIEVFCDGAQYGRAEDICSSSPDKEKNLSDFDCLDLKGQPYFEVECKKENDLDLQDAVDANGLAFGYYSCYNGSLQAHDQDNHSSCDPGSWSPVYCHRWLCQDQYDQSLSKVTDLFSKPYYGVAYDESHGDLIVSDNCGLDTAHTIVSDEQAIQPCGTGWYRRTWKFKDFCGNSTSVSQKIIVLHRSDFEVIFPEDVALACTDLPSLGLALTAKPIISDDECELVSITHTDLRYDIVSESCFKILRTWTVLDECIWSALPHDLHAPEVIVNDTLVADQLNRSCVYRNLKDGGDGYMQYVQIIKVIDTVAPVIELDDKVVCVGDAACLAQLIRLDIKLSDDCDPQGNGVKIQSYIDFDAHAYDQKITSEADADQSLAVVNKILTLTKVPPGKHLILLKAQDLCGNTTELVTRLEVKDCKLPTPYCFDQLSTVIMPSSGNLRIWAKDFDAGSYDNCTAKSHLKFSFGADPSDSSKLITCQDFKNGLSQTFTLNIWVIDETGNKDYCSTSIYITRTLGQNCDSTMGITRPVIKPNQNVVVLPANTTPQPAILESLGVSKKSSISLSFYPNPFSQSTTINIESVSSEIIQYAIVNIQGRVVHQRKTLGQGVHQIKIGKEDLPGPGIYFCQMTIGPNLTVVKLVLLD